MESKSNKLTVESLYNQLQEKDNVIRCLEESNAKAQQSIQKFYTQQKALFDEFVVLRGKYDKNKLSLISVLWNDCARYHPDLNRIPSLEQRDGFVESDTMVGNYVIGEKVGEGQFASVRKCFTKENETNLSSNDYAIKILSKEKITTIQTLKRLSTEIDILWQLKGSEYVISVIEVIHTKHSLYIVTELGPGDLFEFFTQYSSGINEEWAKDISYQIFQGIMHCHSKCIVHRDLKPENILLSFDSAIGKCISLKLCDFGLATYHNETSNELREFCGSPGFFACEMLIKKSYNGNLADIWSIGVIMLEMLVGHKTFEKIWMTAYDYDILQDSFLFETSMTTARNNLIHHLPYSEDLADLILNLLTIEPSDRITLSNIKTHKWFQGYEFKLTTSKDHDALSVHFVENTGKSKLISEHLSEGNLPNLNKSQPKTPNCHDVKKMLVSHDDYDGSNSNTNSRNDDIHYLPDIKN